MRPANSCTRTAKLLLLTGSFVLAGCTVPPAQTPDERLRSQAAADAKQVHHDLKSAGTEARQALVDARRETKDIVAGARQGWTEGGGPKHGKSGGEGERLDLNRASAAELETLPGIEPKTARRIVADRPYHDPGELWKHHLVSRGEFDQIENRLTVK